MLTPLPSDEQTRAMRYVHYVRPDWDGAGIRDALNQLSPLVADPAELLIVMLEWARSKDSRLPAGVIGYVKNRPTSEAAVRTITPPVNDPKAGVGTVWCDTHRCNTGLRPDGQRACCWSDREPAPPRPHNVGLSGGPSPEQRALIEAACGPQARARRQREDVTG